MIGGIIVLPPLFWLQKISNGGRKLAENVQG